MPEEPTTAGLRIGRSPLTAGADEEKAARPRTGPRRTLKRRHVQNWIWLTVMAVFGFAFFRPDGNFWNEPLDRTIDLSGLLLVVAGLAVRVAARGWKHEAPGRNLVTDGLYGYVRHPLYVGSFLIGVGLCAMAGSLWLIGVFCVCFWFSHVAAIRSEEVTLRTRWPVEFGQYRARVGALWPRWSALRSHARIRPLRPWEALLRESDAVCIWLLVAIALEFWEETQIALGLGQHRPGIMLLIGFAAAVGLGWSRLRVRARSLGR